MKNSKIDAVLDQDKSYTNVIANFESIMNSDENDDIWNEKFDNEDFLHDDMCDVTQGFVTRDSNDQGADFASTESILISDADKTSAKQTKQKYTAFGLYQIVSKDNYFIKVDGRVHVYVKKYGFYADIEQINGTLYIRKLFDEKLCHYVNKSVLSEIVEWLKADIEEISKQKLKKSWKYLNFVDYVYSLEDGKRLEHSPEYYFLSYIDSSLPKIKYGEIKENSLFCKYLEKTFSGHEKNRKIFEELLGLAISPIRNIKKSVFLFGPSNSGKSVALSVLAGIVGEEFTSSVSFSQLSEDFAVAILPGKTLNVSGETSGLGCKRIDVYKSITGNDKVTACRKGQDHFQFVNKALLVFACNELPVVNDEVLEPFIERMQIIEFSNSIEKSEKDIELISKIFNEKNIIIEVAIQGLRRFINNKYEFTEANNVEDIINTYIADNNNFILFAKKYIVPDKKGTVASSSITNTYKSYCEREGLIPIKANQWSKLLKSTYCAKSIRITDDALISYNSRGYKGIRLLDSSELDDNISGGQEWDE